ESLANVLLERVERLELAHVLGELVVEGRKLPLLDVGKLDVEDGRLVAELRPRMIGGQGQRDVLLLADRQALDAFLEALEELTGTELDLQVVGTGVLDELAVDLDGDVERHDVPTLRGTRGLRLNEARVRLTKSFELLFNHRIRDLGRRTLGFDALVIDRLDLGPNLEPRLVLEARVRLELLRLDGRLRERLHVLLAQ